ncbi:MAG: hypothetical protein M1814_000799 [Vezdaea aestivalis]|nr:MAG: hypothetical protein M1814_000799 [Vezdaea aestivalis]
MSAPPSGSPSVPPPNPTHPFHYWNPPPPAPQNQPPGQHPYTPTYTHPASAPLQQYPGPGPSPLSIPAYNPHHTTGPFSLPPQQLHHQHLQNQQAPPGLFHPPTLAQREEPTFHQSYTGAQSRAYVQHSQGPPGYRGQRGGHQRLKLQPQPVEAEQRRLQAAMVLEQWDLLALWAGAREESIPRTRRLWELVIITGESLEEIDARRKGGLEDKGVSGKGKRKWDG